MQGGPTRPDQHTNASPLIACFPHNLYFVAYKATIYTSGVRFMLVIPQMLMWAERR